MRDALSDTGAENLAGVPKRRRRRVPPVPRTRAPAPWTRSRREHISRCGVEAGPPRIVIGRAAPPTTRSQPLITDDHDLVDFGTRRNTDLGPDRPIPLPVPLKHVGSWQQRHGGSVDPPERANPAN